MAAPSRSVRSISAEQHYRESLALYAGHDQLGRAQATGQLGSAAYERFRDARAPAAVLASHLNTAAVRYQQALALLPLRFSEH